MVDFRLSQKEQEIQERAEKLTREHITPYTRELEEQGFPKDVVQRAFEEGLMNLHIPEDCGGPKSSLVEETLVSEAIGYGCAGTATSIMCNNLSFAPLVIAATKDQLREYITPLITGDEYKMGAFCLTERESGSDAASIKTSAVKDGDEWVINGSKCFITNAPEASLFTVFATTNPNLKHKGISVFMVPEGPGVQIGHIENKIGQLASVQSDITFEDVRVPLDCLVGQEGAGFGIAMKTLDLTRAGIAAISTGVAQRTVDEAGKFANVRSQFGRPIGRFQGVSFMLADMQCRTDASRHLTRYAAWLADNNLPNTKESAFSKYYASDSAMKNAIDAVQICGGYGYMKEYPVEKLIRDAKLLQIYEGTNQIQRLVASGVVLKETARKDTGFKLDYPAPEAPQI